MAKRTLAAKVLDTCGAIEMFLRMPRRKHSGWLPVVTFHRVLNLRQDSPYLFDEGVVDAAPDEFERHVRTISKYFTPIGIDEAIESMEGAPLPPNPILVTFDDGYKDNFEVALPILQRYGVRAVFFIATHYVGKRRVFWWDRVNFICKTTRQTQLALSYPDDVIHSLATPADRTRTIRALLRVIKSHVGLDLDRFLEHLAEAADVRWTAELDRQIADTLVMSWDQIRELRGLGMDVQSHTRTHRVLQTLDAKQLRSEIHGSLEDLGDQLGERPAAISYPVGYRVADHDDVRELLKEARYKIAFTNASGTHRMGRSDPYDISRIGMNRGTPESLFRAMLAAPRLFG